MADDLGQCDDGARANGAPRLGYSMSAGLVARLRSLDIGLAFTSYQSGLLYLLGRNPDTGGLNVHQTPILRPMGLAPVPDGSFVLAAGFHLIRFVNTLELHQRANAIFDACYVPRTMYITGELDAHDVGVDASGKPIFVNTRFNCLATVSDRYSFEEVWRPPFVSALVDEDRCHLNGLAMREGEPAYVTAVSRSDTIDGWRDRRADGGVVIDVRTGEIVCEGLSMPHSPRLHNGRLWLLNSGTGEFGTIELPKNGGKGRFEPVAFCPGFLRGLAFSGRYAFVGLSKPRYKRFEGLAWEERLKAADSEPWCGMQIIDLEKGSCVDWFRIDGAITELYDLAVLPGDTCPMAVSPGSPEAASVVSHAPSEGRAGVPGLLSRPGHGVTEDRHEERRGDHE
ncbi:TIGR03032 family protein [Mesorhizobium sp. BR1-1-9]|uniref:TIGR03032 family protein n=1 Tax=unclassified Mesorhizobium TaxID=325217 RepID=UPI001CD05542|nr:MULTISPECIES: TIGR03032 family protein [unclassified Mesorhizobium]MBZ9873171.1 TIGR03032 family protein [Mesorhizobium sp. BR1-1-9]MBZ9945018.1 TIGR03032 family protein [Mesorhizobium sp. BR1-1-13]